MFYVVTGTIQSRNLSNPPMDVQWYGGDDLAQAMAALVQCAAHNATDADNYLPEAVRYDTVSVHMAIHQHAPAPAKDEGTEKGWVETIQHDEHCERVDPTDPGLICMCKRRARS